MELILPLNYVKRINMKKRIDVPVNLCSVYDDPAICPFKARYLSSLGDFHLAFHMTLTRVTGVTGNDYSTSIQCNSTPKAAK